MLSRALQPWLLVVLLALPVVLSRAALAEEPTAGDVLVARRLFQSASADEELGRWEAALKTLREVEAIKVTPGVLFHVAVCEQNLGRYVEALNDLGRAEELAQVKGDDSVLELVPARRQEVDALVAHVKLSLVGPTDGVEVTVDGQHVAQATLRLDIPLDPREHTIAVLQPGKRALTRTLTLSPGSRETVQFDLSPRSPALGAEYAQSALPGEEDHHDPNLAKRVVTYSAFTLAIAGTGVGVYFLLNASSNQREANRARAELALSGTPTAPGSECSPPFADDARQKACAALSGAIDARDNSRTLSLWSFATAGAGALGGAAVLLFWPEHQSPQGQPAASLHLMPTLGGAVVSGRF